LSADDRNDAGMNIPQTADEYVNGKPASLVSVLGEEMIVSTIEPFTDYLETSVAAYDSGGNQVGGVVVGNDYCRFLEKVVASKCADAGRKATLAAVESGHQEITNCCGGLVLCACPIEVDRTILGAVVGAVSEVPSDEESLKETARCCGVDFEELRQAAGKTFHKPDYLYDAAVKHLNTLARLLGTIYSVSKERESALVIASTKKQDLDRHIREIEAINKVITAASGSLVPEVFLTQTARAIEDATDARLVAIYTLDDKKGVLRLGGSSFEPDSAIKAAVETLALDGSVEDLVIRSGKVVVVFDLATDERVTPHLREIALKQGFTSFIAMPVISHDEVLGMLLVFSDSRDICKEDQIRFIDLLSYQLGIAVQNSRFYREVESSNQFLNNLLNGMTEGVYIYGRNGAFEFVNRAVTEITGFTREELLGKAITDIVAPEEIEAVKERMMRRKAGGTDHYEVDVIGRDGIRIVVSQTVSPLFENGEIVGAIGVAKDITGELKLERDIERRNRQLGLLQLVMQKSVSSLGRGKALKTLVHEVAEAFSYDICNIFMPADDGSKFQIVASHGFDPDYLEQLNSGDAFDLVYQDNLKTPIALAFHEGKQTAMRDAVTDAHENGMVDSAVRHGFHSSVATPLEYGGERLGVMVVYTNDIRDFDEEELGVLSSIAAQAATIAGTAGVYDRLARSEERYREIYDMAADWMYMLDDEGIIIDCNETMVLSLGLAWESIVGSHIYEHEIETDREKAVAVLERFKEQGEVGMVFSSERIFLSAAGSKLIVDIHARALPALSGDGIQWSVIGRDITEKKEAERRISLLAAAVENTHESVIVSDLNGDIISINNAGAAILGYEPEAMADMHMGEFWSEANPEGLKEQIFTKTLEGGWEGQMWYRRADGSDFPVFVSSARVDDASGKPMALVGIARDISAEQRLTSEILRRNRELAVLNAVAVATSSSLDIRRALKNSLDAINDSMNYGGGIIFLAEKGSQLLTPAASTYPITDEMMAHIQSINVGQGHTGKIAESGEPIFLDDYKSSEYYLPELPDLFPIASMGGVPLTHNDRVLGVLIVSTATPHEFDENERALLVAVGNSLGVAIENANLFEDVARGKNEWETTFDAMTNGVSIHDLDFNIVRANRALAKLLGKTTDQIIGRKCYEVFHDRDEPLEACPQVLAFRDSCSHTLVAEEAKLDAMLNISSDPIFDRDGNITGAVHDVRDITEQERLRTQLAQSEKIRALGEMAGGVAHDFNNFLTVISGNTQLMLSQMDGDRDQEFRESLESVQRAAADAAETVRRIQEFTRVRTARSFTIVNIKSVLLNSIDIARPRWRDEAEARGVKIEIEARLVSIPPVLANESELAEVFTNLIINAADVLRDGGRITVTTDTEPGGDWVRVVVADNGKGMDEEVKKRVFEPFFSTKGVSGSGLGLSVAYGIINRHRGDITVESNEDEGTRFIVRLPVATMNDLTGAGEFSRAVELAETAENESGSLRQGKVLIVDDEPLVRKLLGDILLRMEQHYETAEDGEQALVLFDAAIEAREPFDLVMTDLGMPGISGWDVADAIKQRSPETPVVLITGWGDQLDSQKIKDCMVDSVIAKPFKAGDIRRVLMKAIS